MRLEVFSSYGPIISFSMLSYFPFVGDAAIPPCEGNVPLLFATYDLPVPLGGRISPLVTIVF